MYGSPLKRILSPFLKSEVENTIFSFVYPTRFYHFFLNIRDHPKKSIVSAEIIEK